MMKPVLKWAGSKYKIIDKIKAVLPEGERLIEPFVGSGAVFLNTDYREYLLADINSDLINFYNILKEGGENFIEYCSAFFIPKNNSEKEYYRLREKFNSSNDIYERSALFLYLNRHGYNGLCRYNRSGEFNVPFGRYKKPYFPEKEMIYFIQKCRRSKVEFVVKDFRETMKEAKNGDVIYCDPPYVPLSATANFSDYASEGFGLQEQKELADLAKQLRRKGIPVVISNHDTEFTMQEYEEARIIRFQVRRYISCNGANRNYAPELLAVFAI